MYQLLHRVICIASIPGSYMLQPPMSLNYTTLSWANFSSLATRVPHFWPNMPMTLKINSIVA